MEMFGEFLPEKNSDLSGNKVYLVPLDQIYVDDDWNCRGYIGPADVIELAKDIRENGQHTPVFIEPSEDIVKTGGKRFRLLAGYRRFKASQVAEKVSIKALIKSGLNEIDAKILNLSENLHRKNLDIKQEAHAISVFKNMGWTEQDTARKMQMSRGWVQVRYMLLELPDDVQNEAAAGYLSNQHIRNAYALRDSNESMYAYVKKVKDKKLQGKKREIKPDSVKIKNEKRIRTEGEIFKLQDTLRETFGNNIATKALGWAAGIVTDYEMHQYIWQKASEKGKFYMMPEGLRPGNVEKVAEPEIPSEIPA